MKTGLKAFSILWFVLTNCVTGRGQSAAADASKRMPVLTIHAANRAAVDPIVVIQAEATAKEIFKKAGVEAQWVNPVPPSEGKPAIPVFKGLFAPSHIQLTILPGVMANLLGLPYSLPEDVMGLAPGKGPERQSVYVFYDRVAALAARHASDRHADAAQILGHVIAHEIGHLLLNDESHSASGIMRGFWNLWDLQNANYGHLLFTRRQAKALRAEVSRRFRK